MFTTKNDKHYGENPDVKNNDNFLIVKFSLRKFGWLAVRYGKSALLGGCALLLLRIRINMSKLFPPMSKLVKIIIKI